MAIYIRCLTFMKAAPREDRDAFIEAHKESCSEPRFRTFEAVDESRDGKPKAEPEVKEKAAMDVTLSEEALKTEPKTEKFSSKKKFSKKKAK
jgi:hypothetical protein